MSFRSHELDKHEPIDGLSTDDTFQMPQLQKIKICQHILHGPLGNLLAWYACKKIHFAKG